MKGIIENHNPIKKEVHNQIIRVLEENNLCVTEAVQVLHETEIILGQVTLVKLEQ